MSRLVVVRTLATGSLVSATTAVRAGAGCVDTAVSRTPRLVGLAVRGRESIFRDELLGLARDVAERGWRETRRGLDSFDLATRPDEPPALRPRPYRVKP